MDNGTGRSFAAVITRERDAMLTKPSRPNLHLMPTATLVSKQLPRVYLVGLQNVTKDGYWGHCTACGAHDVSLTSGLYWQRRGADCITQYMVCAHCAERFKKSGGFQERFFKKLEAEAPVFSSNLHRDLPEVVGKHLKRRGVPKGQVGSCSWGSSPADGGCADATQH